MADDYESLLPGIQYAESRGQPDPFAAVGDHGQSHGAFQIQPIMFADIQRLLPQTWGKITYQQMLSTPANQRAVTLDGLRLLQSHYGLSGDRLISAWNTGPTKARRGVFNAAYVKTVKEGLAHLQKQGLGRLP